MILGDFLRVSREQESLGSQMREAGREEAVCEIGMQMQFIGENHSKGKDVVEELTHTRDIE